MCKEACDTKFLDNYEQFSCIGQTLKRDDILKINQQVLNINLDLAYDLVLPILCIASSIQQCHQHPIWLFTYTLSQIHY